ncbi:MAG: gamma-glutamylcyclotransferase [Acidobacteriaceae bacterium]|nr:gamma-glutamylcyclotransferase [Acidobacteriaceae bacterium]
MIAEDVLFVYGTLRSTSGHRLAVWLGQRAQLVGRGRVQGRLFRIGSYPGLVPSKTGGEWVYGEVYRLSNAIEVYRVLDEYEGCGPNDPRPHEFRRSIMRAFLDSGTSVAATVYVYGHDVRNRKRIVSGDFLRAE